VNFQILEIPTALPTAAARNRKFDDQCRPAD